MVIPEHEIVGGIERPDRMRRVVVWRGPDGTFRFVEQARHDVSLPGVDPERWASLGPEGSFCGTAAEAEREAQAAIGWLGRGETAGRPDPDDAPG